MLTLSDIVPATVLPEAATRLELNPLFAEAWREDVNTLPYQPVEVRSLCFSFVPSTHACASSLLRRTFRARLSTTRRFCSQTRSVRDSISGWKAPRCAGSLRFEARQLEYAYVSRSSSHHWRGTTDGNALLVVFMLSCRYISLRSTARQHRGGEQVDLHTPLTARAPSNVHAGESRILVEEPHGLSSPCMGGVCAYCR